MRLVLSTCPPDKAAGIAERLVQDRLAACVNVVPGIQSVYWWKGQLEKEAESLLVMKTTDENVEALKSRLLEVHPYEVPEFLTFAVAEGHQPYLDWVRNETARP